MTRRVLALVGVVAVLVAFAGLALARIPVEQILRYDEATHVSEGMILRDVLAQGDLAEFGRRFVEEMTMKGILYRVYFAVAFLVTPVSADRARTAGLIAGLLALWLVGVLARELARDEDKDAAGFFAVFFAAASPLLGYWGRTAMVEPLNLLTLVNALWLCVRHQRVRTRTSFALCVVGLVVAFFTKYNHAVILFGAVGIDALSRVFTREAKGTPWKTRLAPLYPLAVAALLAATWIAHPQRWRDFLYYLFTVPGGADPLNLGGWTYVWTLTHRVAPGIVAIVVLWLCIAAAVGGAWRPRVRLVAIHFAVGLTLAQMNELKLERILVPLSGDLFVLAGLGAPRLWAWVTRRAPRVPATAGVIAAVALFVGSAPGEFRVVANPLRQLDQVLDRGIDLVRKGGRTLWIGQAFYKGLELNGSPRLTASHIVIRARERGVSLPRESFELMSYEQQERLGFKPYERKSDRVTKAALDPFLAGFDSVVIVYDAPSKEPNVIETIPRKVAELVRANPAFEVRGRIPIPLVDIEGRGRTSTCTLLWLQRKRSR